MSLWTKVEPFCRNMTYDKTAFPALIDSKKYGYFSETECQISGYYQEKFVLIIGELLKAKNQGVKRISHALHIDLETFKAARKIFKSFPTTETQALDVVASIEYHAALEKDFPEAVAKAPVLLGTRRDEFRLTIETMEDLYKSTLSRNRVIKGKISTVKALQGLYNIARALDGLHKKSVIHRDIKNWNIFIGAEDQLLIFDFDFAKKFPQVLSAGNDYEFWDSMTNRLGFVHPFCDVFGWTVTLAMVVWGKQFHTHIKRSRYDRHFIENLSRLPHNKMRSDVYEKVFAFIKSVFVIDLVTYHHSVAYLNAELAKQTPLVEIYAEIQKVAFAALPKMQNCIDLLSPIIKENPVK